MATSAVEATSLTDNRPPWPRLWLAAGAEIGVAVVVAAILFGAAKTTSSGDPHTGMHVHASPISWNAAVTVAAVVTAAAFTWWALTRDRIPAVLTAGGLVGLAVCEPVRAIALQSHLVGMVVLEALLVAVPLLLISTRRPRPATAPTRSASWTSLVVVAVVLNSALLIGSHLPGVHSKAMALTAVPLWLIVLVIGVGTTYWAAILLTAGRVTTAVRLRALLIGQEVAAILGLAAVILPSPIMADHTVIGLSGITDQRLGGVVMLVTCAAVALPLARRLQPRQPAQHPEARRNVQ
ncbi:cytochrome c oxidase assembly protein [Mycolicibacterium sp. XJ2546]